MSDEVERKQVPVGKAYEGVCRACGRPFKLRWNGGELDSHSCCGYLYLLEHTRTDFVVMRVAP